MRKLKLDIDELKVESFAASAGSTETGTVHAHLPTGEDPDFTVMLCGTNDTCIGPTYCCPPSWMATRCDVTCEVSMHCDACQTDYAPCPIIE